MTISVPFQQQFTWRKLGYLAFSDSLSYREVLEQNPQWRVTELPPVGAQIRISPNTSIGGTAQGSFIFGLSAGEVANNIYPFDTQEEYNQALNKYTVQGVIDREALNGITFDSIQAITGVQ